MATRTTTKKTQKTSSGVAASQVSPRLAAYFKDYARFHKNPTNKKIHYAVVPATLLTIMGLLSHVVIGSDGVTGMELLRLDLGIVLWVFGAAWLLYLDWKIATPFALVALGTYFLGRAIPLSALWVIFILASGLQIYGHIVYEKKSPAFVKNLEQLLIGPVWIFAKWIGYHR